MKDTQKAKSKKSEAEIPYQEAVDELEEILAEIEAGEIDVDVLSEKVKRSLFLINYCRSKLRRTDEEVRKLIEQFDKNDD